MAVKTKHQIVINGFKFVRQSDRPYTHAVVVKPVVSAEQAREAAHAQVAGDRKFWVRMDSYVNGGVVPIPSYECGPDSKGWYAQYETRRAKQFIFQEPDQEEYIARSLARRLGFIRKTEAKGGYGWQAASWHEGLANAQKGLAKCSWAAGARIVEVGADVKIEG